METHLKSIELIYLNIFKVSDKNPFVSRKERLSNLFSILELKLLDTWMFLHEILRHVVVIWYSS